MAFIKIAILGTVLLFEFLTIKETLGTSCDLQHPQTAVCRASFGKQEYTFFYRKNVVKKIQIVKILRISVENHEAQFEVGIQIRVYKIKKESVNHLASLFQ